MAFLFDRLCSPGTGLGTGPEERKRRLFQSITTEVERITSERQYFSGFWQTKSSEGAAVSVLEFGIRRSIGSTRTVSQNDSLKKEIRAAILQFEPRLLRPKVEFVATLDNPSKANFSVSGVVLLDSELARYEATFMTDGAH